ncbi:MAG: ABC transporter substrate-binding protein, partial [Rhodospirillaceae bacterium]
MSANAWVRRAGRSLGAAALLFSLIFAAPAPVAASGPQPLVGAFHTALLGVMRDAAALGYQGRYDRLTKPLRDSFHLPLMTQVATGSYWRSATADQRDRLVDAFTRLSIGTYAARFSGFSGQSFVTVGQR